MSVFGDHAYEKEASKLLPSSTTNTTNMSDNIQIRVLVASVGNSISINLPPNELSVGNIRRQLAAVVPMQDQILLMGPPYKVPKDSILRSEEVLSSLRLGDKEDEIRFHRSSTETKTSKSTCSLNNPERTGARRLFLFSKLALSDSAPPLPPCILQPTELKLPSEPDSSPLVFDHSASHPSPLSQALEVYERRFMLHLCRGRALADGADLRLSSCRTCIAEQIVMSRALRAAVSNLSDHRNGAARTRTEFTSEFQSKTAKDAVLLNNLEKFLTEIGEIPLHPSLVVIARSSGRMMETLVDTVPVDKSKEWASQCRKSHERLQSLFKELNSAFEKLGSTNDREEEARLDQEAENDIVQLYDEVENAAMNIRDKQAERLRILTRDHGEVVRVIMDAISGFSSQSQNAQAAFTTLENMSKSSTDILPSMIKDDESLSDLMERVADSKNKSMKRMQARMFQISQSQSNIQKVLSSVSVLRDALMQQCENMTHLERLTEIKNSYAEFLSEIRRRRAYGSAVTSSSTALMERLASMRSDEVTAREKFLRGPGRHLMPAFFEIFAPTLAMPPPLFTPQFPAMIEMDTLPDVGPAASEQLSTGQTTESGSSFDTNQHKIGMNAISNASSPPPSLSSDEVKVSRKVTDADENPDQQSLIVSADEHSNELMDTGKDDRMVEDAERKTLLYENALLRQTLERMGYKSPKPYIDTKKELESGRKSMEESICVSEEVISLRQKMSLLEKSLSEAKDEINHKNSEMFKLKETLEKTDKISHSSFSVGDVGLFMPTGRVGRAKKTYLAFHSNCPHRYLSPDSIEGSPDYILGRIVFQEELIAGPVGSDSNPFGLHIGTRFWLLTVEVLKVP